jgi:hypothetical protein
MQFQSLFFRDFVHVFFPYLPIIALYFSTDNITCLFRPGDDGYGGRQSEGYSGSYGYKDGPPRRDYDRGDTDERSSSRLTGLSCLIMDFRSAQ